MRLSPCAALAAVVLIGSPAMPPARAVSPKAAAALDAYGDPLPTGAVARLGTARLRHACNALAWAPDGKTFASAGFGEVRVWDAATGKEVRPCKGSRDLPFLAILYLQDGKSLAASANDGTIRVWEEATGRRVRTLPAESQALALAAGPEEGTLRALGFDGTTHVWDWTTGKETRRPEVGHAKQWSRMALSPDGKRVAAWLYSDDFLTVWDASTGKEFFRAPARLTALNTLAFSPDGKTLAVSGAPPRVTMWDVETGKEVRSYEGTGFPDGMIFSPDGKVLAGKGPDGAVYLLALPSGKELRRLELQPRNGPSLRGSACMAFSPDGKTLAVSHGAAIRLWDVETGADLHPFTGHLGGVYDVRFSPDGRRLTSCGSDGTARLWDVASAREVASWVNPQGCVNGIVAASDGRSVLAASWEGLIRGELTKEKPQAMRPPGPVRPAAWRITLSGDGKTAAGVGRYQTIHVWNADSGKEVNSLNIPDNYTGQVALSPDGALLAEGGGNSPVRFRDAATGGEVRRLDEAGRPDPKEYWLTWGLVFSPDGKALLHVGASELSVWEVATGRKRFGAARPDADLKIAAFSPRGDVAAAGASDGAILLVDAANGKRLARLDGRAAVSSLAFAPDGKSLASGASDGSVLIWDVKEYINVKRPTQELPPQKLPALWADLLDGDGGRAYRAILTLAAAPKTAAPYLKERLTGGEGPDVRRIARLIRDLDAADFDVREKAEKELDTMGSAMLPAVREALASDPPAESRRRLRGLLDRQKDAITEAVRGLRALEALERSAAPEAVEALRALAKDAPDAAVKKQAAAALERLARRADAP